MTAQHTPGPLLLSHLDRTALLALIQAQHEALEVARRYLRAKNFDAGGRDAVAFVLEAVIAKATGSAS